MTDGKVNQRTRTAATYTRYLAATAIAPNEFTIQILDSLPIPFPTRTGCWTGELRYSPIMLAFLAPQKEPPRIPRNLSSVTFFFAASPYDTLGTMRGYLRNEERTRVYFTEGLASIVLLDFTFERVTKMRRVAGYCAIEHWPLRSGKLDARKSIVEVVRDGERRPPAELFLPRTDSVELSVYVEQISASLMSLWASYGIYFPSERETLRQIAGLTKDLIKQYVIVSGNRAAPEDPLALQKQKNAIISALVEISAALSYAVTQGTSGGIPVLSDRSPFPHHSLLGVGGAIRALTKFTRYLESAFMEREASDVIEGRYTGMKQIIPVRVPEYKSGPEYKFLRADDKKEEHFDSGQNYQAENHTPLIAHFSLRHGFMENKFFVTAASESLTAETMPHWTLMTLSHEIMHSRVRTIFQALFGREWDGIREDVISKRQFLEFCRWVKARRRPRKAGVRSGLRNAVLNFCYLYDVTQHPVPENSKWFSGQLTLEKLREVYSRHKHLAIELFVHFHDYYFVYACQPKVYVRSLWASWIKVAAPYARPSEYLTRSLATLACGSGLESRAAFDYAREAVLDGLASLEAVDITSPLFDELRSLLSSKAESVARIDFDPCYYLIDTIRLYFASRTISARLDSLETDPFSEGSSEADKYTSNIYVYGEGKNVSPIRYSLAALYRTLCRDLPLSDAQWLTAWNYMVISS